MVDTPSPFLDATVTKARAWAKLNRERIAGDHIPPKLRRIKKPKLGRQHHFVIGDSHATPESPNHRYDWLGRMIADRQPDTVIDLGDWADMGSLLFVEKRNPQPLYEQRRYSEDIEAAVDARCRVNYESRKHKCRRVALLGNHEYRLEKYITRIDPRLQGAVGYQDFLLEELGWEPVPYMHHVNIDGIMYCHHFSRRGSAIGGVMPARMSIQKLSGPCRVQGHSHAFQLYEDIYLVGHDERGTGKKVTSIHAGCYFDIGGRAHEWAAADVDAWRSGILELEVENSQIVAFEWTDLDKVQALYG